MTTTQDDKDYVEKIFKDSIFVLEGKESGYTVSYFTGEAPATNYRHDYNGDYITDNTRDLWTSKYKDIYTNPEKYTYEEYYLSLHLAIFHTYKFLTIEELRKKLSYKDNSKLYIPILTELHSQTKDDAIPVLTLNDDPVEELHKCTNNRFRNLDLGKNVYIMGSLVYTSTVKCNKNLYKDQDIDIMYYTSCNSRYYNAKKVKYALIRHLETLGEKLTFFHNDKELTRKEAIKLQEKLRIKSEGNKDIEIFPIYEYCNLNSFHFQFTRAAFNIKYNMFRYTLDFLMYLINGFASYHKTMFGAAKYKDIFRKWSIRNISFAFDSGIANFASNAFQISNTEGNKIKDYTKDW